METTGKRKEYMRRCVTGKRRKKRDNNKGNRKGEDRTKSLGVNK